MVVCSCPFVVLIYRIFPFERLSDDAECEIRFDSMIHSIPLHTISPPLDISPICFGRPPMLIAGPMLQSSVQSSAHLRFEAIT